MAGQKTIRGSVMSDGKLAAIDAGTSAWSPSGKPFRPIVLTLADAGPGRTKYTARVRHWTVADREVHEKMGFHEGWGIATSQREALAQTL
jgi:uncharacterized protein YndB with AHSA1/START domain